MKRLAEHCKSHQNTRDINNVDSSRNRVPQQRPPSFFFTLFFLLLLFGLFHLQCGNANALQSGQQQQQQQPAERHQNLRLSQNEQQSTAIGVGDVPPLLLPSPFPTYQSVAGIEAGKDDDDDDASDSANGNNGNEQQQQHFLLPVASSRSAAQSPSLEEQQTRAAALATMAQLQQQQQQQQASRKRQSNTELFSAPKDRVSIARAMVRLRLRYYSNPGRRMQNLTTCACPQHDDARCAQDGGNRSPCFFTFVAVVGAADQIVDFHSTPFVVVDATGNIDAAKEAEWAAEIRFELPAKPQFVDLYAFNLGPVFGLLDGRIISWSETVWPVDAWQLELDEVQPYSWMDQTVGNTPRELKGRYDTGSQLSLEYSVQCQQQFMGPRCDLSCTRNVPNAAMAANLPLAQKDAKLYGGMNRLMKEPRQQQMLSATDRDSTICHSQLEEARSFECHYRDSRHAQVDSCRLCQFGVINSSICVHDPAQWREEPDASLSQQQMFRTFTIVLAIALAIVLIILLLTCIFLWLVCRRRAHNAKVRRGSSGLGTYRSGVGAPYNISENGFGNNRLADPLMHPLLMGNGVKKNGQKFANGGVPISLEWAKPAQPPMAVQRSVMPPLPQHVLMPGHRSPHLIVTPTFDGGATTMGIVDFAEEEDNGRRGGGGMMMGMGPHSSSPNNNSESSDYRPSPFTPRREAQV